MTINHYLHVTAYNVASFSNFVYMQWLSLVTMKTRTEKTVPKWKTEKNNMRQNASVKMTGC